jgi:hypothetical protein
MMTDTMSLAAQTAFIAGRFALLYPGFSPSVRFTADEDIAVYPLGDDVAVGFGAAFWLMNIGSDDDRYRFELWLDGCDTGIYIEFAFEGETL